MKAIRNILALLLTLTFITACSQEDDLDEIFVGRTWYMNGATINGMKLNSDIQNFYTESDKNAYYITFSSSTFQGTLSAGITFAGTWTADGKKQTISLAFTQQPATQTPFDKQIYNLLSAATSYDSGADFLQLAEDGQNVLIFGSSRNKVYN